MNGYLILLAMLISVTGGIIGTYIVKGEFDKVAQGNALSQQKNALTKECNADKQLTKNAEDKYESQISGLNKQLAVVSLLPSSCVPIIADNTRRISSKVKSKPHKSNAGITQSTLINFAGQCEHDRIEMNNLIDFVNAVWVR